MSLGNTSSDNPAVPLSGIRDNYQRGNVGDFLKAKIQEGSTLSIVSAYFTIYAFEALKEHLTGIESLNFLFGEPRFVKLLDPDRTDKKAFKIEDNTLELSNRLQQKYIAEECARRSCVRTGQFTKHKTTANSTCSLMIALPTQSCHILI